MFLDEMILMVGFALLSAKWFAGLMAFSLEGTDKAMWPR
jgi:hypothetical protein